jgi:glycosyl transferase, family 25
MPKVEHPTILDYFDAVRVINLISRPDRRRAIARELTQHGMPWQSGKVEVFDAVRPDEAAGFASPGTHGCFLSHLGLLKRARHDGHSRVLVMEDDLQLSKRFGALEEPIVDALSAADRAGGWDIVYLGHLIDPPLPRAELPMLVRYHAEPILQAHLVGFNESILDRLITFLEGLLQRPPGHPDGGPMHYDGALNFFRARNADVRTLVANPVLGWQRSSRSDISPKWFDRGPVLGGAVAFARWGRALVQSFRSR